MKNDIVIAHDKLIELGGSEVILKILVKTLRPQYVLTTTVRDKQKWERYLGVKIVSPYVFNFINTDLQFRLLYPLICYFSKYLKYDLKGFDLFIYSSTSVKHITFHNYNRKVLYSNFPLKVLRDQSKYLGENVTFIKRFLLLSYIIFTRRIENSTMEKFNNIYVISQDSKDAYLKYYPKKFNKENVGIIHLPVEKAKKKRKRKKFLEGETISFLLISRLYNEKGIIPFLDEFLSTIGNHALRVIGTGPLLTKMRERYAGKNVKFLGFLDEEEKNRELCRADLLIFPTKQEWSMTVIEANVRGVLCAMLNCPASREINTIISSIESEPNIVFDQSIEMDTLTNDLNNGYDALEKYEKKIDFYFSPKRFGSELLKNLK